jgi:hypothetical protein
VYDLGPTGGRQEHGVDEYDSAWAVGANSRQLESDQAAEAVSDNDGASQSQPAAHPGKVVGERLHRVRLRGRVALAVAAKIHGDDAAILRKAVKLRCPKTAMASHAVHQE